MVDDNTNRKLNRELKGGVLSGAIRHALRTIQTMVCMSVSEGASICVSDSDMHTLVPGARQEYWPVPHRRLALVGRETVLSLRSVLLFITSLTAGIYGICSLLILSDG